MVISQRFLILLVLFFLFPFGASANVVINEIAWMGTENSANDEWIELYNSSTTPIDLTGWSLEAVDGTPTINIAAKAVVTPPVISAGGFLLFERTDDTSVPAVSADVIYTGVLGNVGEILVLKDSLGEEVDRVDGADGWRIGGSAETVGDNTTKQTAQLVGGSWVTATATPRAINAGVTSSGSEEEDIETPAPFVPVDAGVIPLPLEAQAGEDVVVEVGTEITLDASGSLGADTFIWYLGDASQQMGEVINHTYSFPGRYLVTLEISNGSQISIDQLFISVFGGKVIINEFYIPLPGQGLSWIEFLNPTETAIDLGGWSLEVGDKIFIFPPHTVLFAGELKVISEEVFGFSLEGVSGIQLRLPNKVLIDEVVVEVVKPGWAAARQNNQFFWTSSPTPTFFNIVNASPPVFIDNAIRPVARVVVEPEVTKGKNLIFANSGQVQELIEEVLPEEQEPLTASLLQETGVGGRNSIIFWIIGVFAFSLFISVGYIFILRKRKNRKTFTN